MTGTRHSPAGRNQAQEAVAAPDIVERERDAEARRERGLCVVCLKATSFIADRLGHDSLVLCWHCEAKGWELWKGPQPETAETERAALRERLKRF